LRLPHPPRWRTTSAAAFAAYLAGRWVDARRHFEAAAAILVPTAGLDSAEAARPVGAASPSDASPAAGSAAPHGRLQAGERLDAKRQRAVRAALAMDPPAAIAYAYMARHRFRAPPEWATLHARPLSSLLGCR
jgi:hypothetical protein